MPLRIKKKKKSSPFFFWPFSTTSHYEQHPAAYHRSMTLHLQQLRVVPPLPTTIFNRLQPLS
jgi:hypothetical protein